MIVTGDKIKLGYVVDRKYSLFIIRCVIFLIIVTPSTLKEDGVDVLIGKFFKIKIGKSDGDMVNLVNHRIVKIINTDVIKETITSS